MTAKVHVGEASDGMALARAEQLTPLEDRIKSLHSSMISVRDLQDLMREQARQRRPTHPEVPSCSATVRGWQTGPVAGTPAQLAATTVDWRPVRGGEGGLRRTGKSAHLRGGAAILGRSRAPQHAAAFPAELPTPSPYLRRARRGSV